MRPPARQTPVGVLQYQCSPMHFKKPKGFARAFAAIALLCTQHTFALSTNVVISQVYGGGGSTGSVYQNDFIELFNRGTNTVRLDGWSVQYAAATTGGFSSLQTTPLSGSIFPGQYYLIQESAGATNTGALPTPDCVGNISLSFANGKVALVSVTNVLSTGAPGCPTSFADIVDFVGYGTANCFESSPAPSPSTTDKAVLRKSCVETDNNALDFLTATASARNSSTPFVPCSAFAPFFTSAARTNNEFTVQLVASSAPAIEGSPTLTNWTLLGTATNPGGTFYYFTNTTSLSNRFYRCKN
jgi:hypothetical protein